MEYCTEEVRRLRESTSSGPSTSTPDIVKTKALYPEQKEIGWRGFNFLWCKGYSQKIYRRGLDLLIHKDPNDFIPHHLRPILLFDIKANLHNKNLGRTAIRKSEYLNSLSPKQYESRKEKSAVTQSLNTLPLYNIIRLKRVPETSNLEDII